MKKLYGMVVFALIAGQAHAVDGVFAEYGNGNSTDITRVGVLWNWDKQWKLGGGWLITSFWEASAANWRGHSDKGNNQSIIDIGVTPVFRLQQQGASGVTPYLEAAIGFHLISPTFINADRKFSSAFQFGDHVGAGVRFGDRQQYDLTYRYQHLSNGGIREPNQGINFNEIHLAYHF